MSDATSKRPFKVWNVDRSQKHSVVVNSFTDLLDKGRKKLGIAASEPVHAVLEEDGTLVEDEDYFQLGLKPNDTLMLLRNNETWSKEHNSSNFVDTLDGRQMDEPEMDGPNDGRILRSLARRLKFDMKSIFLLNNSEYEILASADSKELSTLMNTSVSETERVQSTCQRLLDERQDYDDAKNLLELLHRENKPTADSQQLPNKRKRKN